MFEARAVVFGFELWVRSGRAPYGAVPVHEQLDQEDHVEDGGDGDPELRVLLELRRRKGEAWRVGWGGWIGWVGRGGLEGFEGETRRLVGLA